MIKKRFSADNQKEEIRKLKQFQKDTMDLIQSFKDRDLLPIERILIGNFEEELVEKIIENNYKGSKKRMTENKRYCKDCKYCRGIGYDFWCGEGHTAYEVFFGETNCPYYEFHDWSKGAPNRTKNKRFEEQNPEYHLNRIYDSKNGKVIFDEDILDLLNDLNDENELLKQFKEKVFNLINTKIEECEKDYNRAVKSGMPSSIIYDEIESLEWLKKELEE